MKVLGGTIAVPQQIVKNIAHMQISVCVYYNFHFKEIVQKDITTQDNFVLAISIKRKVFKVHSLRCIKLVVWKLLKTQLNNIRNIRQ